MSKFSSSTPLRQANLYVNFSHTSPFMASLSPITIDIEKQQNKTTQDVDLSDIPAFSFDITKERDYKTAPILQFDSSLYSTSSTDRKLEMYSFLPEISHTEDEVGHAYTALLRDVCHTFKNASTQTEGLGVVFPRKNSNPNNSSYVFSSSLSSSPSPTRPSSGAFLPSTYWRKRLQNRSMLSSFKTSNCLWGDAGTVLTTLWIRIARRELIDHCWYIDKLHTFWLTSKLLKFEHLFNHGESTSIAGTIEESFTSAYGVEYE